MVAKKKQARMRGSREHGRGRKKGRGAGLRGGKGHAGSMNHKFVHYLIYEPEHFAYRRGFKRPPEILVDERAVNVSDLETSLPLLVAAGAAVQAGDAFTVDLAKAGYAKLLGSGRIATKVAVTVARASENAVKKVKAAGGSVSQTAPAAPSEPQRPAAPGARSPPKAGEKKKP